MTWANLLGYDENMSGLAAIVAPDPTPAHAHRALLEMLRHSEPFQSYQHAFEQATGLPLTLCEADFFQPPLHGSRHLNPFCIAMTRNNHACAGCLRAQAALFSAANRAMATRECDAG